jgi:putative ABC transport system substrate-binding protein
MHGVMRLLLALVSLLVAASTQPVRAADGKLIYVVLWRGCEEACEGFKAGIAESGLTAEIVLRDAAQDKGALPGFVEEARALGPISC